MLSGTRLLNLSASMMKSGTYTHSKWSEYMVTNHKRHFFIKSFSGVDNVHHVPISGRHCCAPVVLPKWNTLCSINVPSYRCISTTGMFFYTPNNSTGQSNGSKQLPNGNNSSKSQSKGRPADRSQSIISRVRSWMPTIQNQQPSVDFTKQQSNSWPWWRKVIFIGTSIVSIGTCIGAWGEEQWKVFKVDRALLKGTKPNPIPIRSHVDRQETIDKVVTRFIKKNEADDGGTSFGIIFSPTGTGKTHIVTQACHQQPEGVLYYDIMTVGNIAKRLAKVVGMRTEPTLIGKWAGYFFGSPIGYYQLSIDDTLAVGEVVTEIAQKSEKLKKTLGRPVCLFIDQVDIIAKRDEKLFMQLVDMAKTMANKGSLRMIFVSSEGYIFSLLKRTSSQARSDVMEIDDITEGEAIKHLCGQGLPDELAEDIVKVAGPRALFCYHAINEYDKKLENKDALNHILKLLRTKFVYQATYAFVMGEPATASIIQELDKSEKAKIWFDLIAFYKTCGDVEERAKLEEAVDTLVKNNVLRYSEDYTLHWHNKLARTDILKRLNK